MGALAGERDPRPHRGQRRARCATCSSDAAAQPAGARAGGRRRRSRPRACSTSSSSIELLAAREPARTRHEPPRDPGPGRHDFFRDRSSEGRQLRGQQRLLPGLDRPPPRRLRVAASGSTSSSSSSSVGLGFAIAFALALLAHRRRWLVGPITRVTGILYTIPSLAFFFLLLPITGLGVTTALIPLTAYTLLILFRNIVDRPRRRARARRATPALGMGLTDRQLLWRVELPLALPEIIGRPAHRHDDDGGLAALAAFAGAGGLGDQILTE